MGQWRKSWYLDASVVPVVFKAGGDSSAMADLTHMSPAQIQAMQMLASAPTRDNRVTWFLEGMLQHDGLRKLEYDQYDKLFALKAIGPPSPLRWTGVSTEAEQRAAELNCKGAFAMGDK